MSKSVIAKRSRAYRLLGTYAVLSFQYTLQAVLAGGSGEAQVTASPGSGRRRGAMVKGAVVVGSLAVAIAGITLAREAGAQVPPLSALPVPGPANLADFVSDPGACLGGQLLFNSKPPPEEETEAVLGNARNLIPPFHTKSPSGVPPTPG